MPFRRSVIISASEDRLQQLIAERLAPGADKEAVDRRIWDLFGEEWCVMVTDLTGFSRGVAKFGIVHFLQTIYESERLFVPIIERYDGIILKAEGDSFLMMFRNTHKALAAAIEMQRRARDYNRTKSAEEQVLFGAGLGFGRVLRIGDTDVFGQEVNAAYILGEDTACAYEILATNAARNAAGDIDGVRFEAISEVPPGVDDAFRVVFES